MYTTHEYLIAAHVAEPMYIGYYSALSHHGLTEQVPRTVYVVTPTRAQSREIHGVPYRVTTVTGRKFFGTTPTSIEGTTIQVSDLEKTLVDCADHPGFCGGIRELACAMRAADEQGCSWETVGEYLERLDNGAARPSGSSTSPTSLASAFPPERGSSRRSRVAIPCWTPRVPRPGRQPARTGSASISSWTRWRRRSPS